MPRKIKMRSMKKKSILKKSNKRKNKLLKNLVLKGGKSNKKNKILRRKMTHKKGGSNIISNEKLIKYIIEMHGHLNYLKELNAIYGTQIKENIKRNTKKKIFENQILNLENTAKAPIYEESHIDTDEPSLASAPPSSSLGKSSSLGESSASSSPRPASSASHASPPPPPSAPPPASSASHASPPAPPSAPPPNLLSASLGPSGSAPPPQLGFLKGIQQGVTLKPTPANSASTPSPDNIFEEMRNRSVPLKKVPQQNKQKEIFDDITNAGERENYDKLQKVIKDPQSTSIKKNRAKIELNELMERVREYRINNK